MRPRAAVRPIASTVEQAERVRLGPVAPSSREEIVQAALREPVRSPAAAAVRALGTSFRAVRERQPTLEERREQLRDRFEQAREQVFGREGEQEAVRELRRAEAAQAADDARARAAQVPLEAFAPARVDSPIQRAAQFAPPERPEPVVPTPRALEPFSEPVPPSAFDIRG